MHSTSTMYRWCKAAKLEKVQALMGSWSELEDVMAEKRRLLDTVQMRHIAQGKIVVGCTTSGAAKYRCGPVLFDPQMSQCMQER